jgi:platelet-activating factor acetylhydrolase IB subunit alpha
MVLTDRQRTDLHAGIYEYLLSRPGFTKVASALAEVDPDAIARYHELHPSNSNSSNQNGHAHYSNNDNNNNHSSSSTTATSHSLTPLLEKKWTAIPRLQKKVLELERTAAYNAKIHAHRDVVSPGSANHNERRLLPRLPCQYTLQGHAAVVTTVAVHPVYTIVVSGSEDGTIKVSTVLLSL